MTYQECLDFLYSQLPMYQKYGQKALKYNLGNIQNLCEALDSPQNRFKSVHVAGTNGKGSSCHALASILQRAGYKTGLYTSPHLKDYRERIKINGNSIERQDVVKFVEDHRELIDKLQPSFFEITVALAFYYFSKHAVDIAVIEVGLGGRLDSTNIINPVVSLITNIGYDHEAILGETLAEIADEKAGIIKSQIPVVVGETDPETEQVFVTRAEKVEAPLYFSYDRFKIRVLSSSPQLEMEVYDHGVLRYVELKMDLNGPYQTQNVPGVLQTVSLLNEKGFNVSDEQIRSGLANIISGTGIKGRWQQLGSSPAIICDTGHNLAAMEYIVRHLLNLTTGRLHMVLGFVNDKNIRKMLATLPSEASYYFCSASVPRSLPAQELQAQALDLGLKGVVASDPNAALAKARDRAKAEDLIFVGGSTFVVAALEEI